MKTLKDVISKHDTKDNDKEFTYLELLYGEIEYTKEQSLKLWNDLSYSKSPVPDELVNDTLCKVDETMEQVMAFIHDLSQLDINQFDNK